MHAASADRVIHTCYCYESFNYVFKLLNLTRFLLELMTELTLEVSEISTLSIQIYCMTVFVKIGNADCRMHTIKTLPGVDTSRTGDDKIRADGLEMFKNYTRLS